MANLTFRERLAHGWNAFKVRDDQQAAMNLGYSTSYRPDRQPRRTGNERSIVQAVLTRMTIDLASFPIKHVRLNENDQFVEVIKSGLNECLSVAANIDQAATAFRQDAAAILFDEGHVALVPTTTSIGNPEVSGSYDIETMRAGIVKEWMPQHVRVNVYNDELGIREDILLSKKVVAIIYNPLYDVMNQPNSILQRLIRKLNLLDAIDEQSGSGKLDLIIQLPYSVKTQARQDAADKRRQQIEEQLAGSKYGIAYIDGTERVTQLNRPAENNLMAQITYLTSMLYSQLGITDTVMSGTADEPTMLNYYNRTISPCLNAMTEGMTRTFLTKTARSQYQSIKYFRDPFSLVPVNELADIADKFTRNEILSSNEMRAVIGMKPSDDPKADELRNKNINAPTEEVSKPTEEVLEKDPNVTELTEGES